LGRFITRDELAAASPVAVLGEATWRARFLFDPRIVGRVAQIDGRPFTIVGVMRADHGLPSNADFWRPLRADERADNDRELTVVPRAADPAALHADLTLSAAGTSTARRIWTENLQETQVKSFRASLALLWVSAIVVLTMVCASVAALVGARTADRAG